MFNQGMVSAKRMPVIAVKCGGMGRMWPSVTLAGVYRASLPFFLSYWSGFCDGCNERPIEVVLVTSVVSHFV